MSDSKDEAVLLAARAIVKVILDLLDKDGHTYSSRPCPTCKTVSGLAGEPFGCERRQKR